MQPVRYFVVNAKTGIAHIYGYCQQTKPRSVPIRLFENFQELEQYACRPLQLCCQCSRQLEENK